jgi:hypothetical protein
MSRTTDAPVDRLCAVITSEMVSILSVGLPALGAALSAIASFIGARPGGERRLHRLVVMHKDMPAGEGRDALEDAINQLAVGIARRAVTSRESRRAQRPHRKVDRFELTMIIITILIGGGLTWFFWWLGSLAPWPLLQWPLWIIAILISLVVTLVVMTGDVFKEQNADRQTQGAASAPGPEEVAVADEPLTDVPRHAK